MKITNELFEISPLQTIAWSDVKSMRMLNDKLAFVLSDGKIVEIPHLRPATIDLAFRSYENYLREHPEPHQQP